MDQLLTDYAMARMGDIEFSSPQGGSGPLSEVGVAIRTRPHNLGVHVNMRELNPQGKERKKKTEIKGEIENEF